MVPFSLKVLAKFGLFSQKFHGCSHVRVRVNMCSIARNFVNPQKRTLSRKLSTNTQKISFPFILVLLFPSVNSLSLLEASLTIVVSLNSFSGIVPNDLNFLDHVSYGGPRPIHRSIYRSIYRSIHRSILGRASVDTRSSTGRYIGRVSVEYRSSIDRCIDRCIDRYSYRSIYLAVHRYFTDTWPILDRHFTDTSSILHRYFTDASPILYIGRYSTDTRPIGKCSSIGRYIYR